MRKIIKPGKTCERCGTQLTNDVYEDFCDICKEKIPNQDEQYPLRASVFHEGFGDTTDYEFCSWNCFFDFLTNFPLNKQTVNFVSLPYISGSASNFKEELDAFLEAMIVSVKQSKEEER